MSVRRRRVIWMRAFAGSLVASLLVTASARAEQPNETHGHFTATALAGWSFGGDGLGIGIAGFGYGARLGYTLASHVYVGALFVHHVGENVDDVIGASSLTYSGLEFGYEFGRVGRLNLRPYAGTGVASAQGFQAGCECGGFPSRSGTPYVLQHEGSVPIWFGFQPHVIVGPMFIGVDVQVTVFFAQSFFLVSPSVFGEAGVVFD